ncbi:MAG TPA: M48 family metallopeptidase [Allosphingosinicella sp.]|jgi:Zn-dependent protease with chaperone function|nr:M48 family metallopeptidase [Allosphingosinicella sp.]
MSNMRTMTPRILFLAAAAMVPLSSLGAQGPSPASTPVSAASAPGSFLRAPDHRIAAIVYRLGLGGRAHCPSAFPLTGIAFHHLADYRPEDRAEAIARYGLDRGPGILSVIEGSPAAAALLQAGDVIVSVNGNAFPPPAQIAGQRRVRDRRAMIRAAEELFEDHLRRGPATLEVARGAHTRTVKLSPVSGCPARGRLARSGQDSAFADGRYAIMTTDFLDFFRSDDELAVALAHELAHNILGHPQQLREKGVPNSFLRHLGRNARLVRATEVEADKLSVRLLHGAGYDLDSVLPFWRRLLGRLDSRLMVVSAHPGMAARERYLSAEIAAIRGAAPAR